MLQQATDYWIYDQAFFLSGIESAEGKEEKKNPSPPKQKGKKDRHVIEFVGRHFSEKL